MNNFRLVIRKNIPKLRDLLNNLGYHYNSSTDRIHSNGYIYVTDFKYYIVFDIPANCIDCGEDEQTFIKYLYKHTECYIREHNKTELTINQKRLLENSYYRWHAGQEELPLPAIRKRHRIYIYDVDFFPLFIL